jgi:hypothetical protein
MNENVELRPKRGDTRADGRRFWSRIKGEEYWVTPEHFDRLKAKKYAWQQKHLHKDREAKKRWREAHPEKSRAQSMKRYWEKREEVREYQKKYRRARKPKEREYRKELRKKNPLVALRMNLRSRMWAAFIRQRFKKPANTEAILGATVAAVRQHLEAQFQPGMSWENYGDWHVDHITPLASAKTMEEVAALCHHTNLQPLWAEENLRKGAKIKGA